MIVIQILGPSYSGSTVLGYALNTIPGYIFGSELRRILPAQRRRRSQRPSCDFCGVECEYWSDNLFKEMDRKKVSSLDGIYEIFSKRHPEVVTLVDASKTVVSIGSAPADYRILCKKHPIRLLASYLYNDRKKYKIKHEKISDFGKILSINLEKTISICEKKLSELLFDYKSLSEVFPNHISFKSDHAHLNDFRDFRFLEKILSVTDQSIKPTKFSSFPCHSVGGNRAPVWISKASQGGEIFDQDRFRFYQDTTSFGDWKIDNKYSIVFSEDIIDRLSRLEIYSELCEYLGYDKHKFDLDLRKPIPG